MVFLFLFKIDEREKTYLKLGLSASGRNQGSTTASYLRAPSLRNRVLIENLVRSQFDLLPGILYVLALAETRANGESQKVRVFDLRRDEMDVSCAVDFLQESFVELVGTLSDGVTQILRMFSSNIFFSQVKKTMCKTSLQIFRRRERKAIDLLLGGNKRVP